MSDRKRFEKAQKGIRRNRRRTVSPMREAYGSKVIAIFLADIHLSLKAPVWRSAESDWLEAQSRPLLQISSLQQRYEECPVFCAGDVFDKWNACPELINWAIDYLPDNMYAIPGQHDLPLHQYEDIGRSAYWTLVKAGKIQDIKELTPIELSNFIICGFPFGSEICPLNYTTDKLKIAIVHDYVWIPGHSYPDAPEGKKFGKRIAGIQSGKYFGYDVIVYGDNHKGFIHQIEDTTIFNCGTLMRRKSDEIDYRPQVGLLLESGEVIPHYLDISKDKYLDTMDTVEKPDLDIADFISGLEKLGKTALDFRDAMKQFLDRGETSVEAKEIILNAMEK